MTELTLLALLLAGVFGGTTTSTLLPRQGDVRRGAIEGPEVPFGQPVGVDQSLPRAVLETGFAHSDADGTWVTSSLASLRFNTVGESAPTSLALAVYPFTSEAFPTREIQVATSRGTSRFNLTGGGQVVVVQLDGSATQLVTIRCQLIGSPLELGLGDDVRPLCIKLIWFEVT